jgi:hypothetical protein
MCSQSGIYTLSSTCSAFGMLKTCSAPHRHFDCVPSLSGLIRTYHKSMKYVTLMHSQRRSKNNEVGLKPLKRRD